MSARPEETPQGVVALAFANAIAARNYDSAYSMLSSSLKPRLLPTSLRDEFNMMIDYAECPPENPPDIAVINVLDEWPAKKDGDVGWAYVAMSNDYYCEAVSVVVVQEHGRSVIRELEWGRP